MFPNKPTTIYDLDWPLEKDGTFNPITLRRIQDESLSPYKAVGLPAGRILLEERLYKKKLGILKRECKLPNRVFI